MINPNIKYILYEAIRLDRRRKGNYFWKNAAKLFKFNVEELAAI